MDTISLNHLLSHPGPILLDGGLATELERKGTNLDGSKLWSSALLLTKKGQFCIQQAHQSFAENGAYILGTSTYQASLQGFAYEKHNESEYINALSSAILLTKTVSQSIINLSVPTPSHHPLIAVSMGPLGAIYGNGSEFTGAYGLPSIEPIIPIDSTLQPSPQSYDTLYTFHYERVQSLLIAISAYNDSHSSSAISFDVIAFETIPCILEIKAISHVLRAFPQLKAWISVTIQSIPCHTTSTDITSLASIHTNDEVRLVSGELLQDIVPIIETIAYQQVIGIGMNCSHPSSIGYAIQTLLDVPFPSTIDKPATYSVSTGKRRVIVYPNRGEKWIPLEDRGTDRDPQPELHTDTTADSGWRSVTGETPTDEEFLMLVQQWKELGVWGIGGCCRVSPELIRRIHETIIGPLQIQRERDPEAVNR